MVSIPFFFFKVKSVTNKIWFNFIHGIQSAFVSWRQRNNASSAPCEPWNKTAMWVFLPAFHCATFTLQLACRRHHKHAPFCVFALFFLVSPVVNMAMLFLQRAMAENMEWRSGKARWFWLVRIRIQLANTQVGWRTVPAWAARFGRVTRVATGKQKHAACPNFRLDFTKGTFWLRPQERRMFTLPHCSFPLPCEVIVFAQWSADFLTQVSRDLWMRTHLKPVTTLFLLPSWFQK